MTEHDVAPHCQQVPLRLQELGEPGAFGNLPCGEAFIAPVEGTGEGALVVSGSIASIASVILVSLTFAAAWWAIVELWQRMF